MENGPGGEPGGQPIPGGSRPPPTTPGLFGPPRLRIGGDEEDRHASWLEAFFDLVFVAPPGRYLLWAVGLAVDFATPLSAGGLHARFAPSSSHLPERFGLFTLIVLGETIGAVVVELATHPWSRLAVLTAFSGLILAFAFWWVYFDNLDDAVIRASRERGRIWIYQGWLYAHLPFYAAIAATGVGVDYAIRADQYIPLPDPQRWLVACPPRVPRALEDMEGLVERHRGQLLQPAWVAGVGIDDEESRRHHAAYLHARVRHHQRVPALEDRRPRLHPREGREPLGRRRVAEEVGATVGVDGEWDGEGVEARPEGPVRRDPLDLTRDGERALRIPGDRRRRGILRYRRLRRYGEEYRGKRSHECSASHGLPLPCNREPVLLYDGAKCGFQGRSADRAARPRPHHRHFLTSPVFSECDEPKNPEQ